jgi:hypothetical protein
MAKTIAMVFGWIFLIIGVLGFISNPIVGDTGIFHADLNHNLVHIVSGIIFLWVSYKSPMKSSALLKIFGAVYLIVAILGFFMGSGSILGLIEVNSADNWLHLVLALVFIWAGLKAANGSKMSSNEAMM